MKHAIRLSFFTILGFFGVLGGCSSSSEQSGAGEAAGPEMKIRKRCLATECDVRMEDAAYACEACLDACFDGYQWCDPSTACDISCSTPSPCSDWEQKCEIEGYEVTLPNDPSPEIAAACERMVAHVEACGYDTPGVSCSTYAAVERPEVAPLYDCVANLSCNDLMSEQAMAGCAGPTSTFGDQFCSAMSGVCGSYCSSEEVAELDALGGWLRSDVTAAALWCTGQATCNEASACFWAWKEAIGY